MPVGIPTGYSYICAGLFGSSDHPLDESGTVAFAAGGACPGPAGAGPAAKAHARPGFGDLLVAYHVARSLGCDRPVGL